MILWRLSTTAYARNFDGGYGLLFDGRWNSIGHAVTYCATSPSLCILEKLVHVGDPDLLPALSMVTYDVPDTLAVETITLDDMPDDWRLQEAWTQQRGNSWHRARSAPLLSIPSAIVPIPGSPDVNMMINHNHPDAGLISIENVAPFSLDMRLFAGG